LVGLFVFFFFFYPFVFSQALDHQRFSQDRRLYRTAGWWQKAHPSNPPSISKFFFSGFLLGGWWHRNARSLGEPREDVSCCTNLCVPVRVPWRMKFPPLNPSTTTSSSLQVMAYLFRIFFNPLQTYLFFFSTPKGCRSSTLSSVFFFCLGLSNINMEYYTHEQKK
jgi:hypothetical protein